jgi:two-component system, OmpR family, sensor histidine kinase KdpD
MTTNDRRPDPDALLARVRAEEPDEGRGRLRIFLGYAAGVGKTYAMLEAARRERDAGGEVVVGYVEPHGRKETETLLEGLEAIPPRRTSHQGVLVNEFDVDAALARRPKLLLVDELAHTNVSGSRNAKRWQDVAELLDAGIDVWTTMNVQHIESLNDVVAGITGVVVRETIPDAVLERAEGIELIDVTPEELLDRLRAGKVYQAANAMRALENFFQRGNLVALRELSLRQAADRVRRDVEAARNAKAATAPWATSERLLVCVGPSPTSAKLIRASKRMAAAFHSDWLAVAVESGAAEPARRAVLEHLRLAEQLGAETHSLVGRDVAASVLDYARSRNVTKIVVGKTAQPWFRRWLRGSVVDELLEKSGDIDVYVIRGDEAPDRRTTAVPPIAPAPRNWRKYAATAGIIAASGVIGWVFYRLGLDEANIAMVFLLGVAIAARLGTGPAVAASIGNVLVFDFFFIPPRGTFAVADIQYLFTFAVMLVVGLLISALSAELSARLRMSQLQEQRTSALFRLAKQLSLVTGVEFLLQTAGKQLEEIWQGQALILLRGSDETRLRYGASNAIGSEEINNLTATWVADHERPAGLGTDTLPNATAFFVPLVGAQRTLGAVGVRPEDPQRLADPEQQRLLETCASLIALSIERDESALEAAESRVAVESEKVRSALLSSVSHDLRTPLAAIAGATDAVLAGTRSRLDAADGELLRSVVKESGRLGRLVENLLDLTRLEAGVATPKKDWQVLEEIVGSALNRLKAELEDRRVELEFPEDLPLVHADGTLIEQVLINLVENAVRYTPPGTTIAISARPAPNTIEIHVADEGPGLPPGEERRIFEKFVRGDRADGSRGVGLGLAICDAIVQAHGGSIKARNRTAGGAEFIVTLPVHPPPAVR